MLSRLRLFCCLPALLSAACGPFPMSAPPPLSEWRQVCDAEIARERAGLPARENSWDDYWCGLGQRISNVTSAESRQIRRYLVEARRAAGLPELTCAAPVLDRR